jgi:hypothetical protein
VGPEAIADKVVKFPMSLLITVIYIHFPNTPWHGVQLKKAQDNFQHSTDYTLRALIVEYEITIIV